MVHTIKKTRGRKRLTRKRGGSSLVVPRDLAEKVFSDHGIVEYYAHAKIIRDFFIPQKVPQCHKIPENAREIKFINRGFNGFILKFSCNHEAVVNAVKILFNRLNDSDNPEKLETWRTNKVALLEKEYTNIERFKECEYIIKTNGYFLYDGLKTFNCFGKVPYNENLILGSNISDANYLSKKSDGKTYVEPFGGIIMEYVNYSMTDIGEHLSSFDFKPDRVLILMMLFYQYLDAIDFINSRKYFHTDIKLDNLMFNKVGEIYTAKIIDLANIKPVDVALDIGTNSKSKSLPNQYHFGALEEFRSLQANLSGTARQNRPPKPADPVLVERYKKTREEDKTRILERYDLYCLAITFKHLIDDLKRDGIIEMDETKRKFDSIEIPTVAKELRAYEKLKTKIETAFDGLTYFERKLKEIQDNGIINITRFYTIPTNKELGKEVYDNILLMYKKFETAHKFWSL